jgi:hypothetical protein
MKITTIYGLTLLFICLCHPALAVDVSNRPGDSILGGHAGFSSVSLAKNQDRIESIQVALRGSYFFAEKGTLGGGLVYDRVAQENTTITAQRYLVELTLVPIPDANVSPFIRIGGGYSKWEWDTGTVNPAFNDAITGEGALGFFAFVNDYFAVVVDATYFYDNYNKTERNDADNNVTASIGFVGFLR